MIVSRVMCVVPLCDRAATRFAFVPDNDDTPYCSKHRPRLCWEPLECDLCHTVVPELFWHLTRRLTMICQACADGGA
jgi:hypothetical protein